MKSKKRRVLELEEFKSAESTLARDRKPTTITATDQEQQSAVSFSAAAAIGMDRFLLSTLMDCGRGRERGRREGAGDGWGRREGGS